MVMFSVPTEAWNGNVIAASQTRTLQQHQSKILMTCPLESFAIPLVRGAISNDRLWQILLKRSATAVFRVVSIQDAGPDLATQGLLATSEVEGPLFYHLRVELGQGAPQLCSILEVSLSGDEPIQSWREKDQVPAWSHDPVGMGHPSREKDCGASRSVHLAMLKPKAEASLQKVPSLIVAVVNVQVGRPGVGPLADDQGVPYS